MPTITDKTKLIAKAKSVSPDYMGAVINSMTMDGFFVRGNKLEYWYNTIDGSSHFVSIDYKDDKIIQLINNDNLHYNILCNVRNKNEENGLN